MGDAGYRGVSAAQDGRYRNKEQALLRKLASTGQFPPQFEQKVQMNKVNLEVIKPWISDKVGELLGFDDDVVVEYIHGMLEDPDNKQPDPKKMQLSLTGFLESNTAKFMAELWNLLLSAQTSLGGIPQEFVEKKKQEMKEARERDAKAIQGSGAVHDHRARDGGPSRFDGAGYPARGSGRDQGGRGRGRGRGGDRFGDQGQRSDFTDRSGNRTERVQDRGWGARSRPREEGLPGRAYEDDRDIGERRSYRYDYDDSDRRRPSFRDRSLSPDRGSRARRPERSLTPVMRRGEQRKSRSPIPVRRARERSRAPEMRSRREPTRSDSRSYSRSYSPPRSGRNRPRSYSRSPPRRRLARGRSPSRSYSPPRQRRLQDRRYSRSRSSSYSPSSQSHSPERRTARGEESTKGSGSRSLRR